MALKKNLDIMMYEKLNEEIIGGRWAPGQTLNLDELAEHYDVSRTPVQQALKRMEAQGMVTLSSKGHFSVLAFSEKEVKDIIEIRLLLEQQAISDIEEKSLPVNFKALKKICQSCIASNEANDTVRTRSLDLEFHRILVEQAENQCLKEIYTKVQSQFMVANYLLTDHTQTQQEVASGDHKKLLDALEKKNFKKAHNLLKEHIDGACRKIISKMKISA